MSQQINIYKKGQGPGIVMLHGWGMNATVFDPLVQLLSAQYQVVQVDLPGHGQSNWSEAFSFDQQVELLAQVLPSASVLLGWSMGGLHATSLAKRYPEKFERLVLMSSNPCFVQQPDWPCAVERSVFDEFARTLIDDWEMTIKRFIGLQMHGSENARKLVRQITRLLIDGGKPHPDALRMGLQFLLNHDARPELAELNQPILSILGDRDMLVPKSLAQEIHLINARIRVECLAHSAHVPFVSHTKPVAELLSEFIESSPT